MLFPLPFSQLLSLHLAMLMRTPYLDGKREQGKGEEQLVHPVHLYLDNATTILPIGYMVRDHMVFRDAASMVILFSLLIPVGTMLEI